jgi:hypothetical protein
MLDICQTLGHGRRQKRSEVFDVSNGSDSQLKSLPDPSICQTKHIGIEGFSECLVNCPHRCPHALSFGYAFFCNHPDRRSFETPASELN